MNDLFHIIANNWQPIAVSIGLLIAAIRAAWMEKQRRQMMGSSKRAAELESSANVKATQQVVDGMQTIIKAKDEAVRETNESIAAQKEEIATDKRHTVENLKKNPNELLDRLSKITGAKRVDK